MPYDGDKLKVVGTRPIRPDGVEKVMGRANFGADMVMPGMLWGKIKRSPHAHARIVSINTEKALKLPGVKAVVTSADFPEIPSEEAFMGEGPMNFRDLSYNCMARGKALYDGHAVAGVAAISPAIAEEACDLIEVQYEVLPYAIDVEDAMKPDAPVLHDDLFTQGVDPKPAKPSNIAKRITFTKGDVAEGWREAEIVVERKYTSQPVHQAYIEPHACVVSYGNDAQCTVWSSSQGQFMVRAYCAKLLGIDMANIRAIPAEIGGGFGGKTLVYLEPVALALSKKAGRPVKIVMSREEVFRGTGPAPRRTAVSSPPSSPSHCRPAPSPARRSDPPACAAWRCTTFRMSISSATTSCRTARKWRPTVRRARRTRPSAPRAASTSWPAS
jgi:CO/xanthine dehydrogenase Mo-binding subunit